VRADRSVVLTRAMGAGCHGMGQLTMAIAVHLASPPKPSPPAGESAGTPGCPSAACLDGSSMGHQHSSCKSFGTARRDPVPGSHLGSPLKPGRPVLTLGISRCRGVSGLYPHRRLTERGAAHPGHLLTPGLVKRPTKDLP
jgi:hypothetical protein